MAHNPISSLDEECQIFLMVLGTFWSALKVESHLDQLFFILVQNRPHFTGLTDENRHYEVIVTRLGPKDLKCLFCGFQRAKERHLETVHLKRKLVRCTVCAFDRRNSIHEIFYGHLNGIGFYLNELLLS